MATKAWNADRWLEDGRTWISHTWWNTHISGSFHLLRGYLADRTRPDFQGFDVIIRFLVLSCLINGPLCLKDLIRKQLFGCRFLCCVLKSNQAPITVTTDLAKSTHVVWFTVMLLPSVAAERCPRRNGVRLLKLTEAIPRKSPILSRAVWKILPGGRCSTLRGENTPKVELLRSEQLLLVDKNQARIVVRL